MSDSRQTTKATTAPRSRRVAALALLVVAAALAVAAGAGADPLKDPNTIACPAAPSGWGDPAVVKDVATPQSVPEAAAEEHFATGGNAISVRCIYFATSARPLTVSVTYALPTDVNPINDFYWGCGTGNTKWDDADRVFMVPSIDQWALATFSDFSQYLGSADVSAFENVARQLLGNAEGYGHACDLKVEPTAIKGRYSFDFRLPTGGRIESVFWTRGSIGKSSVLPIIQATVTTTTLRVKANGKTHTFTIRLARGIDYLPRTAGHPGRIRYATEVASSKLPSCHRGAKGTLTITTAPSVLLRICGQTFLKDVRVERIRIGK